MVAPEPVAAKPEAAPANPKRGKKAKAGLAFESPRAQHCFQRLTRIFPPQTRHLGTSWAQISVPKTDPQRRSTGADSDCRGLDRAGREWPDSLANESELAPLNPKAVANRPPWRSGRQHIT
jgi:hypothetical protein